MVEVMKAIGSMLAGVAMLGGLAAEEASPEVSGPPQTPRIEAAIARGDADDVRRHLLADPTCLEVTDPKAKSPLDLAILRKREKIALLLLEAGADPSRADASGATPLHHAVTRNLPAVVAALMKAGAQPNERDRSGWTPLHHAAAKNQLETTVALLDGGADPMTLSKLGGTPLHEAAVGGSRKLLERLLQAGVDPTVKSKEGVTALDLAKKYENAAAVEALSKPRPPAPAPQS